MYNVSNDYKTQMGGAVFKFDLEGRLTNTGAFYADNILAGSLTITNQCSSGDKIIMGSVYAGELRATFVDTNDIVVGDTITVSESLYVDSLDRYETIPLGAFKVAESVVTRSGIEVVAYDYMSKFDKKAELAQVYGTPFEWLRYCCSMCNVTMAQTQAEIEALPNGLASFECYMREGFECTYRDVVSWLAQIIGGFATMDREGRVKLVSYAMAQTPVYDVRANARYNDYSFSLHTTEWDAISYTYVAGGTEETEIVGTPTSEDTTFAFGYNPFLQNRADASTMLTNLLSVVESMTYVPFRIRMACGAPFDLGDLLTQFGGHTPNPITSRYIITCIDWKYNGGTTLSGAGKDVSVGSGGSSSSSQSSGGGGGGGQTYNDFAGATASADGARGLVPAPLIADREKFLCGDGTWKTVSSGAGDQTVEGTFTTGSYQYDKVEVDCGFIPDYIEVVLPFPNSNTIAYYNMRISTTFSYWIIPVESRTYTIALGSTSGETGISDITETGFKFRCNAGNTRNVQCTFVAKKYGSTGEVNYSTTEQKTGRKWIDGRDVWERTYEFTNALACTGQGWTDTGISNSGIALIINSRGTSASGTCWNGVGASVDTGTTIKVYSMRSGADIQIKYLTIEYVKTS